MFKKNTNTGSLIITNIKSIDYHFYWVGVIAIIFLQFKGGTFAKKSDGTSFSSGIVRCFASNDLPIFHTRG